MAPILYGDGIADDAEALEAALNGAPYRWRGALRNVVDRLVEVPSGSFRLGRQVGLEGGCASLARSDIIMDHQNGHGIYVTMYSCLSFEDVTFIHRQRLPPGGAHIAVDSFSVLDGTCNGESWSSDRTFRYP